MGGCACSRYWGGRLESPQIPPATGSTHMNGTHWPGSGRELPNTRTSCLGLQTQTQVQVPATTAARLALSPTVPQAGCSLWAQQQPCSAPFPAHGSCGRELRTDLTAKGARSVQHCGRLVILYLALSRSPASVETFSLSQPLSRVHFHLTRWQNNQTHQLGSPTGRPNKYTVKSTEILSHRETSPCELVTTG